MKETLKSKYYLSLNKKDSLLIKVVRALSFLITSQKLSKKRTDFMRWLTQPTQVAYMCAQTGYLPVNPKATNELL